MNNRDVFLLSGSAGPQKIYFSAVGDPARWEEGFPKGVWCGTPAIARFVAMVLNKILSFGAKA